MSDQRERIRSAWLLPQAGEDLWAEPRGSRHTAFTASNQIDGLRGASAENPEGLKLATKDRIRISVNILKHYQP